MFLAVPSRTRTAHVVTTRRTCKHTVQCTYLLLRSQREDGKVRNETQGNRSRLPDALIGIILLSLPLMATQTPPPMATSNSPTLSALR
jgi:hypothetical protein